MTTEAKRYCAPPDVVALLARDGLGWGHDVECGSGWVETTLRRRRRWFARGGRS